MRVAFFDPIPWDYTVLTPLERPLGGSQSALCYLATQLAADGWDVSLINNTSTPGVYAGVRCLDRVTGVAPEILERADIIVVSNHAMGRALRGAVGARARMVLWSGHATNGPEIAPLRDPIERAAWDAFALVSRWQASEYVASFGIEPSRIAILRNAIAPAFEIHHARESWFKSGKPPVLAYTTTPYRGLEILRVAFPRIRASAPGARLKIFSGMKVYQIPDERDPHRKLYRRCAAIPGVEHIGNISQVELARAMSEVDILAYPSIFAETSCISVMEAMAAGCVIVASSLAALPETMAGHGVIVPLSDDPGRFASAYATAVQSVIAGARREPTDMAAKLERQVAFARSTYTWKARAEEWRTFLSRLVAR
jgi:glycosyltransferase involved in cell wall biosynthesis